VSEATFEALERLKRRHARNWPELTLKAIVNAYSGESEEDAQDCRQVEAELRGEATATEPSEPVEEAGETTAELGQEAEAAETDAGEGTSQPPAQQTGSDEEPRRLQAPVVTCRGCQERMTRGTMVVKRPEGYYHPQCVLGAVGLEQTE
jgi:hypothetical protein